MNFFEHYGYSKEEAEEFTAFCDKHSIPYECLAKVLLYNTYPISMELP